jgi:hypothetical protein
VALRGSLKLKKILWLIAHRYGCWITHFPDHTLHTTGSQSVGGSGEDNRILGLLEVTLRGCQVAGTRFMDPLFRGSVLHDIAGIDIAQNQQAEAMGTCYKIRLMHLLCQHCSQQHGVRSDGSRRLASP